MRLKVLEQIADGTELLDRSFFEVFVAVEYGHRFSLIDDLGDDYKDRVFTVHKARLLKDERRKIYDLINHGISDALTGLLLTDLCNRGYLDEGRYKFK
ncbi:hypothetical protein COV93_04455 [Candidatus Woesearchaeota archaeon CG11_big_fil_rev_8_21_14_0_20_43_8]|nr:MAG: hypothetical protein COV93_04455 [Candidatus Woesearchaeota archaeon CG11_big_fil_rev_8_21_14_0_20_43_8]